MLSSKEEQEEFDKKLADCKAKGHNVYTETSTGGYLPFLNRGLMLGFSAYCKECKWSGSIRVL
jgi:hypothetical protein